MKKNHLPPVITEEGADVSLETVAGQVLGGTVVSVLRGMEGNILWIELLRPDPQTERCWVRVDHIVAVFT